MGDNGSGRKEELRGKGEKNLAAQEIKGEQSRKSPYRR